MRAVSINDRPLYCFNLTSIFFLLCSFLSLLSPSSASVALPALTCAETNPPRSFINVCCLSPLTPHPATFCSRQIRTQSPPCPVRQGHFAWLCPFASCRHFASSLVICAPLAPRSAPLRHFRCEPGESNNITSDNIKMNALCDLFLSQVRGRQYKNFPVICLMFPVILTASK